MLTGSGSERRAVLQGIAQPAALTSISRLAAGTETPIWYCVRPEHIVLRPAEAAPIGPILAGFQAQVTDIVYQGTTILVDLEVPVLGKMRAERSSSLAANLKIGETIELDITQANAVPRD